MTEIKEMDYAALELRVLAQHPRKCTVWSTPTMNGVPLLGFLEAIDSDQRHGSVPEDIIKDTLSPAEARRLFRELNPAGNNQIEKAHFLRSRQEQAETAGCPAGFIEAVDSERRPSLMRPRINTQGTITGRFKATPNIKEVENKYETD